MLPWQTIESVKTRAGVVELRQRGEKDFLITIAGRVLMTSMAHRSEDLLATLSCSGLGKRPKILLGGLGMGFTLRAALDQLPADAQITVVDLNPQLVEWNRGPLGFLTGRAVEDPRVKVVIADVAQVIGRTPPGHFDAIVIDLYEGPHAATNRGHDPLYGPEAIARTRAALRPGGIFAVWSEERDRAFEDRLAAAQFDSRFHKCGKGGRIHVVYVASPRPLRAPLIGVKRPPIESSSTPAPSPRAAGRGLGRGAAARGEGVADFFGSPRLIRLPPPPVRREKPKRPR
jgi:predicted membrane-bound spermidine synthase